MNSLIEKVENIPDRLHQIIIGISIFAMSLNFAYVFYLDGFQLSFHSLVISALIIFVYNFITLVTKKSFEERAWCICQGFYKTAKFFYKRYSNL